MIICDQLWGQNLDTDQFKQLKKEKKLYTVHSGHLSSYASLEVGLVLCSFNAAADITSKLVEK